MPLTAFLAVERLLEAAPGPGLHPPGNALPRLGQALIARKSPEGEVGRVAVVLQVEHARKSCACPEILVPTRPDARRTLQPGDAAPDGLTAGFARRHEPEQG